MPPAVWLAVAYLSGSVPYALLLGFTRGVDIRKHGSGNVGATNAGRVLGKKFGIAALILDLFKGLLPVLLFGLLAGPAIEADQGEAAAAAWQLGVAAAAVVGHVLPLWLGFKGGKGVATSLGVLLGVWPVLTVAGVGAFLVWYITLKKSQYVGLASVAAAGALPLLSAGSALAFGKSPATIAVYAGVTAVLAALVIYRHRGNLARLRAGTEPKAGFAKQGAPKPPLDQ